MKKNVFGIVLLVLGLVAAGLGQAGVTAKAEVGGDITGLYSFVNEGEFVQIEANDGNVGGVISRFKNEDREKAEFVDQYLEQGKLEGSTLSFRTAPAADGIWFEFSGTVERGGAKSPQGEGYWNVRGKLTEHSNVDGKATEKVRELTLKSFPAETDPEATGKTEGEGTSDKKE
jgi:hypothetical protein